MVVIDARNMEPPEPFERVMSALDALGPGEVIKLMIYREPTPLYRVLRQNGYRHRTAFSSAGYFEVEISADA